MPSQGAGLRAVAFEIYDSFLLWGLVISSNRWKDTRKDNEFQEIVALKV